jgi:hypothetical protein
MGEVSFLSYSLLLGVLGLLPRLSLKASLTLGFLPRPTSTTPVHTLLLLVLNIYKLANALPVVSEARISKQVDRAMDKAGAKARYAPEGVSVRNGPILDDKMDVDEPSTNGVAKRKARVSSGKAVNYNVDESESSDDAVPLVWSSLVVYFASRMRFKSATSCAYTILTRNLGQASKGLEEKGYSIGFG